MANRVWKELVRWKEECAGAWTAGEQHGLEGEESQDHGLKTVKAEEKEFEGERATALADKGREPEEGLKG